MEDEELGKARNKLNFLVFKTLMIWKPPLLEDDFKIAEK